MAIGLDLASDSGTCFDYNFGLDAASRCHPPLGGAGAHSSLYEQARLLLVAVHHSLLHLALDRGVWSWLLGRDRH